MHLLMMSTAGDQAPFVEEGVDGGHDDRKAAAVDCHKHEPLRPPCTEPPIPDVDDLITSLTETDNGTGGVEGEAPAAATMAPGALWLMPQDAPDEIILQYMERWIRVAGPVVGLRLRP